MRRPVPPAATALAEAISLHQRGKLNPAKKLYRAHLERRPNDADALEMLGTLHGELGEFTEAARVLARAVAVKPDATNAHFNLGLAKRKLGRHDEAGQHFAAALALAPSTAAIHYQLGLVAMDLARPTEAIGHYEAALRLNPRLSDALVNLGQALAAAGRLPEAIRVYESAHQLQPEASDILFELGEALIRMRSMTRAADVLGKAAALAPKSVPTLNRYAAALRLAGRHAEALDVLKRAAAMEGTPTETLLELTTGKRAFADWKDIERLQQAASRQIARRHPGSSPLLAMLFLDDPALLQTCSETFARNSARQNSGTVPVPPALLVRQRSADARLRIGYISSDFGEHPVGHAIGGMLRAHDRRRFEVHAYSTVGHADGPLRRSLRAAVERFRDVHDLQPSTLVDRIREAELDILVDLNGHTAGSIFAAAAARVAPIQVNFLGFPGTMGVGFMDYIIADPIVIPPGADQFYGEKVVRLPHCYLPNDLAHENVSDVPARAAAGLPASGRVVAAFNGIGKLSPAVFSCWMRLLAAHSDCVLWLAAAPKLAIENLRREAAARGIAPDRLIFASFVNDRADHLARLQLAELALDTLPYNGHTTTAEALWAGVPVVTTLGEAFPGRVAASALAAAGIPELAQPSLAAYEAKAMQLLADPAELASLRARLVAARKSAPLYDVDGFTRHLEQAFVRMVEIQAEGRAPDPFSVDAGRN